LPARYQHLHRCDQASAPARNLAAVEDFCSRLDLLAYGSKASLHYGQISTSLARSGTPIGGNDLHIAAHARSEGLLLENWA
jgi:tRNA(fMet)-specific endonuclease VapC